MPTYIAMLKWTAQGLREIKQSSSRLDAARKRFEGAGIRMKEFYMLMGHYDAVTVVEAPDDTAIAKAVLALTSQGNITSETSRAFTEEEYKQIVTALAG